MAAISLEATSECGIAGCNAATQRLRFSQLTGFAQHKHVAVSMDLCPARNESANETHAPYAKEDHCHGCDCGTCLHPL